MITASGRGVHSGHTLQVRRLGVASPGLHFFCEAPVPLHRPRRFSYHREHLPALASGSLRQMLNPPPDRFPGGEAFWGCLRFSSENRWFQPPFTVFSEGNVSPNIPS